MTLSINVILSFAVFLTVFGTIAIWQIGPIHVRPYQVAVLFAIVAMMIKFFKREIAISVSFRKGYLFWLICFFLSALLSVCSAEYLLVSIKQLLLLGIYILFLLLIINVYREKESLVHLHRMIIYSCLIGCLYGLVMLVMKNIPGVAKEGGYYFTRPRSFFVEPNEFGLFLVFVYGYVFAEYHSRIKIVNRRMLAGVLLLIFILIIPNMSRGSWIGMFVATGIVLFYEHSVKIRQVSLMRIARLLVIIVVLSVSMLLVISNIIPTKFDTSVNQIIAARMGGLVKGDDPTYLIRKESNKKAIAAMIQKPFTGIGIGNIFTLYDKRELDNNEPDVRVATSSNFISDVAAETGVLGIGALLIFIASIFIAATSAIKRFSDPNMLVIFVGALASFAGLIANGLTYAVHMLPFMWISAGILILSTIRRQRA